VHDYLVRYCRDEIACNSITSVTQMCPSP
jgi:hypothetical protein